MRFMSTTLTDTALEFVRAHRAAQALPEIAHRLAGLATKAEPGDLASLESVLRVLNVPQENTPQAGRDFENQLRSLADRTAHEVYRLGIRAAQHAAIQAAKKDPKPGHIPIADFGHGGIFILDQRSTGRGQTAFGLLDKLGPDHELRNRVAADQCPTVDGEPVVYLGHPAQGLDGNYRPGPSYPLAQAVGWTLEAGRQEKEKLAQDAWEESRRDEEARERGRGRKPRTLDEVNAAIDRLEAAKTGPAV
jgi:hypothetical protein